MNLQKNKPFILFSTCIPVLGKKRSIICDLERHEFLFIPNQLYDIITDKKTNTINDAIKKYGEENEETILEYFNFLLNKDIIFFCTEEEKQNFPPLKLLWKNPASITNAIIDYNNNFNFKSIINQLSKLNCSTLQLRSYTNVNLKTLEQILELIEKSTIINAEFIIPYANEFNEDNLISFFKKTNIVDKLFIHSANENKKIEIPDNSKAICLFMKQKITSSEHCGIITPNHFSLNIETISEAQKHNTCLNRKISIDVNGEIKNCPAMKKSYGNIKKTTLEQALNTEGFKDLWFINKDKIEVCKDCEFRYICTDCRAFLTDENNIYSKPAKCKYNPYTAEFEK